jgi:hypothetical protein
MDYDAPNTTRINDTVGAQPSSRLRKLLIWMLAGLAVLVGLSFLMVQLHAAGNWDGGLMFGSADMSDSIVGWMIAIPVIVLTMMFVVAVLAGTGIFLAAVFAMLVVLALLLAIFGLALTVLPVLAFLAVPVAFVWLVIKAAQRKQERSAVSA